MYNHNKAQQSKKSCAYFLGYTVWSEVPHIHCYYSVGHSEDAKTPLQYTNNRSHKYR